MLFRKHTLEINRIAMEQKAVSIADTLSSFQQNPLGGYGAYIRFLNDLAMAEVWIVDKNLNISKRGSEKHSISHTELPENAGQIVLEVFSGKITYGEEFSGLLGVSAMTVGAPIWLDNGVVGAVLIHSPVSGITTAVTRGLITVIISCASALLVAGILATLFSYRLTKPLLQMKNAAIALSQGNYETQTNVASQDEIGQLARVLDNLSLRLKMAEIEKENLNRMREDFVANISHELRTPVSVLRGSLELLEDGTVNSPEEVLEYYHQMLTESRHLERLVNDLLELSRLQDIGFHLQMGEINISDAVKDAVRSIRSKAQDKNITIITALPDWECIMMGDYDRIRQLLIILLTNAIKFSFSQGIVEVSVISENGCTVTVTDYGSGIAPDDIPHVFDRFHKSNNKENYGGTGLGLAIAEEIVKRHNGTISVKSDGVGTSFRIVFK